MKFELNRSPPSSTLSCLATFTPKGQVSVNHLEIATNNLNLSRDIKSKGLWIRGESSPKLELPVHVLVQQQQLRNLDRPLLCLPDTGNFSSDTSHFIAYYNNQPETIDKLHIPPKKPLCE